MTLSTNLDVEVSVQPIVAGITRGVLRNDWVECPFEIAAGPPGSRGVVWKAVFTAKDDPSLIRPFNGAAETRRQATQIVTEILTSAISATAQARLARRGLKLVDYDGVTAPASGLWAALRRAWAAMKRAWRTLFR